MKEETIKQHEETWNRAVLGANLISIGPFNRSHFPLLKTKPRYREYFVRADALTVVQCWINENKEHESITLFYPSKFWIDNYESKSDKRNLTFYEKLYEKLKENGMGQLYITSLKPKLNSFPAKKKINKPKKVALKKSNGGNKGVKKNLRRMQKAIQ